MEKKLLIDILIDSTVTKAIDHWADTIIEWERKKIEHGKDISLYFEPLWYEDSKDIWADTDWWINLSKKCFEKKNNLVYLEILLELCPNEYREIAREKINKHYYHGIPDSYDWYDTLRHFYPELKIAREVFEDKDYNPENQRWLHVNAWQMGYEPARSWIEEDIQFWVEDLDDNPLNICSIYEHTPIALGLGKKGSETLFPPNILSKLRSKCLILCKSSLEEYWDLVRIATVMEWYELLDALENNPYYFKWLFEEKAFDAFLKEKSFVFDIKLPVKKKEVIEYRDFQKELLAWSLTPHKQTTLHLAYLGIRSIPEEPRSLIHFAMAIAWKRARSPIVFGASNREK